jgi:aspartyl-tRNA(Asn)/glutamyl-tRNA(Gln) amidotransferase subunit C
MPLTIAEVEHIAALARLDLSEEEKARFRGQLSAILDYFAQLQDLDTGDIPPTFGGMPESSRLREDEPRPGLPLDDLLSNAPRVEQEQFRVPPILE